MRRATVERITKETQIRLTLSIWTARASRKIATPLPFFNHMLDTVARHGLFDLELEAQGDVEVDGHHTVEDVGIVPGAGVPAGAGRQAGHPPLRRGHHPHGRDPGDGGAWTSAGGRRSSTRPTQLKGRWIGDFDAELAREFFGGFVSTALCNLHLEVRYGENAHHIVEALFKAFARAAARGGGGRPARGGACPRPRGR